MSISPRGAKHRKRLGDQQSSDEGSRLAVAAGALLDGITVHCRPSDRPVMLGQGRTPEDDCALRPPLLGSTYGTFSEEKLSCKTDYFTSWTGYGSMSPCLIWKMRLPSACSACHATSSC